MFKSSSNPPKHIHFQDIPHLNLAPLRTVVVERPKPTQVEMMPYVAKVNTLPADQFYVPDLTDIESSSSLETMQSIEPPPINYSTHPSTPHWLEIYNDTPSLLTYYNAVNPCEVRTFFILCRQYLAVFYLYKQYFSYTSIKAFRIT